MAENDDRVVPFPFSRMRTGKKEAPKDLGLTPLSREIDPGGRSAMGHWCSRCRGIWYSYFLEVECPACGNRHS